MLAKLIKLDLRFAYKKFLTMAAVLLAAGLTFPWLNVSVLKFGLPLLMGIIFTVIPLLCIWLVVQHFQRNLYGNEGYLMFSLPVSASQLLLSKVVTTILWFNLMLASAFVLALLLLRDQAPVLTILRDLLSWEAVRAVVKVVLLVNVNMLPLILAVFMGLSLATVAIRNKKLGNVWGQIISAIGIVAFAWCTIKLAGWNYLEITTSKTLIEVTPAVSMWINAAVSAAFCTLFFSVNSFVMRRRLNLS